MTHYDFVEIGTSEFNTLIENANDEVVGLSIEPITHYLNNLPNPKNVKKINCAIVENEYKENDISIFYIPPETFQKFPNLDKNFRGCNSIGSPHKSLIRFGLKHLLVQSKVPVKTIKQLFIEYQIQSIDYLKIDTEGYDCFILNSMLDFLEINQNIEYPKKILFECNILTPKEFLDTTVDRLLKKYQIVKQTENDIEMVRK